MTKSLTAHHAVVATDDGRYIAVAYSPDRGIRISSDPHVFLTPLKALELAAKIAQVAALAPKSQLSNYEILEKAAAEGETVSFEYQKPGEPPERREIEVDSVFETNRQHTIVSGFDIDANDYRQFRLDRIVGDVQQTGV